MYDFLRMICHETILNKCPQQASQWQHQDLRLKWGGGGAWGQHPYQLISNKQNKKNPILMGGGVPLMPHPQTITAL